MNKLKNYVLRLIMVVVFIKILQGLLSWVAAILFHVSFDLLLVFWDYIFDNLNHIFDPFRTYFGIKDVETWQRFLNTKLLPEYRLVSILILGTWLEFTNSELIFFVGFLIHCRFFAVVILISVV